MRISTNMQFDSGIASMNRQLSSLVHLQQQIAAGAIDPDGRTAVIVLTGHGLKDPGTAVAQAVAPVALPAKLEALEGYLAG